MKHEDKKLLGIVAIGMSAWLLVIAILVFDNTTTAMLTNNPVPSASQSTQTHTLGATSDEPTLHATSASSSPESGEVKGDSITQAPASNLAITGAQNLSNELETSTATQSSKLWIPIAFAAGILLIIGTALWAFTARLTVPYNQ